MTKEFQLPELSDDLIIFLGKIEYPKKLAEKISAAIKNFQIASVEAYKAMNAVPIVATEVDFVTCPTCGEDDILASVKAGAQSVAVPDEVRVALDTVRADASYLFGRVAADGSFSSAAVNTVKKHLDIVATWHASLSQPPAPEQRWRKAGRDAQ